MRRTQAHLFKVVHRENNVGICYISQLILLVHSINDSGMLINWSISNYMCCASIVGVQVDTRSLMVCTPQNILNFTPLQVAIQLAVYCAYMYVAIVMVLIR